MNADSSFGNFIAATLGTPPPELSPGRIVRFGPKSSCWAFAFADGTGGVCGDWRTGERHVWQADRNAPAPLFSAKAAAAIAAERADRRESLRAHWEGGAPARASHGYLRAKGVGCYGLRYAVGALLVPGRNAAGELVAVQRIYADSSKRFLAGSAPAGAFHLIGDHCEPATLIVAEGYATAATLHEVTGLPAVVAFFAGNLRAVAEALRGKWPAARIILAADDDHASPDNPGLTAAENAARAVNGLVAVPTFPACRERWPADTDLNDLHRIAGAGAVRRCIAAAAPVLG